MLDQKLSSPVVLAAVLFGFLSDSGLIALLAFDIDIDTLLSSRILSTFGAIHKAELSGLGWKEPCSLVCSMLE